MMRASLLPIVAGIGLFGLAALVPAAARAGADAPLVLARTGPSCAEDPTCFNRLHPAIPPVAHSAQGQRIVFETRDAGETNVTGEAEFYARKPDPDTAARVHPLTGPVFIDGAHRGDVLAVTIVDVEPAEFGYTLNPAIGLLADLFPDPPTTVIWKLDREFATSSQLPGVRIPYAAFPGVVTVLPGKQEVQVYRQRERALAEAGGMAPPPLPRGAVPADLCGPDGKVADACLRTIPPREHGGNLDIRYLQNGATVYLRCQIDGCGLAIGDVHYAQGDGEVAGAAIEMSARVTVTARVVDDIPLARAPHLEGPARLLARGGGRFHATTGLPIKQAGVIPPHLRYLDSAKVAGLTNLSRDLTLAARNALLEMIDYLVQTRGLTRVQAYILASVAVDMRIGQLVDGSNVGVMAILPLDIFTD